MRGGEDADFHKKPEDLQAIEKAPFYAIQITPNTNDSFGQLAISTKAEVLDADRKPVPGLYAGRHAGQRRAVLHALRRERLVHVHGHRHRPHRRPVGSGVLRA